MPGDDALPPSFAQFAGHLEMPSEDYRGFLKDYFTGPEEIRQSFEEDRSIWGRLTGSELESAKRMILDNLASDPAYIRALGIFRDPRALPSLEALAQNSPDADIRLTAAKTLYDWIGNEGYPALLEAIWPTLGAHFRRNIAEWVLGMDRERAERVLFAALRDKDQVVRFMAYLALARLTGVEDIDAAVEQAREFTSEAAYENRDRYEEELTGLSKKLARNSGQ